MNIVGHQSVYAYEVGSLMCSTSELYLANTITLLFQPTG